MMLPIILFTVIIAFLFVKRNTKQEYFIKPKYGILLFVLFCVITVPRVVAQNKKVATNNDLWFTLHGDHKINNKFGIESELHFRRTDWGAQSQQFLFRPSVYYGINDFLSVYLGYTHIQTYPYGDQPIAFQTPENNALIQSVVKQSISKFNISHRYRYESRWIGNVSLLNGKEQVDGYTHRNRFRYRVTVSYPIQDTKFSIKSFDEIWLNFGNNVANNGFDQNWFYLGVDYKILKFAQLGVGYMHQHINKPNGVQQEKNNTIQVTLSYKIPFKK